MKDGSNRFGILISIEFLVFYFYLPIILHIIYIMYIIYNINYYFVNAMRDFGIFLKKYQKHLIHYYLNITIYRSTCYFIGSFFYLNKVFI